MDNHTSLNRSICCLSGSKRQVFETQAYPSRFILLLMSSHFLLVSIKMRVLFSFSCMISFSSFTSLKIIMAWLVPGVVCWHTCSSLTQWQHLHLQSSKHTYYLNKHTHTHRYTKCHRNVHRMPFKSTQYGFMTPNKGPFFIAVLK